MIEIKAYLSEEDGEKKTCVQTTFDGRGEELVNEALAVIQATMKHLKDSSELLHAVTLKALADDPWILTGSSKEEHDDEQTRYAKFMADMTDKSIIGKERLN